jgi:hypothetical protein
MQLSSIFEAVFPHMDASQCRNSMSLDRAREICADVPTFFQIVLDRARGDHRIFLLFLHGAGYRFMHCTDPEIQFDGELPRGVLFHFPFFFYLIDVIPSYVRLFVIFWSFLGAFED